jgi:hypothetical protein
MAFATIMFWKQIDADGFSVGRLIFGVWLPGMVGGLMVITFWILLVVSAVKRM